MESGDFDYDRQFGDQGFMGKIYKGFQINIHPAAEDNSPPKSVAVSIEDGSYVLQQVDGEGTLLNVNIKDSKFVIAIKGLYNGEEAYIIQIINYKINRAHRLHETQDLYAIITHKNLADITKRSNGGGMRRNRRSMKTRKSKSRRNRSRRHHKTK